MTIRALIADDQEIVRKGMAMILGAQPGIEVVGEASNGAQAVRLAQHLRPDVCLFDIRMPVLDGIEATRRLAGPGVDDPLAVIVITTFDTDDYIYGALQAGARGFLLKGAPATQIVEAMEAAVRGDALVDAAVTARLLQRLADHGVRPNESCEPIHALTEREEAVLMEVARGRTNAEIARDLFISLSTVKFHVAGLLTKLGLRNRVELAMWAYRNRRLT
ncbi:response regulator transcription factor [Ornithinimicrobium sp. Arc0846-15]|nr:response regulator transcription factor [Ornithinimicrobium laminariae]